ncbi:MAG: alpha-L-arabinofuranosidase C-terminal domain-containing protein [Allomuricauda sp.]
MITKTTRTISIFLGFFLCFCLSLNAQENKVTINLEKAKDTISRFIYGHFAEHLGRCIYGGIYVGRDSEIPNQNGIRLDVVEALKEIKVPVLRWPGGCFAEQYHWRDGIGPLSERPKTVNAFWGGITEDNSFGTHEFLELCEMLDAEPYIAVNVASGTVKDAYQWIEYVTSSKESAITRLRKQNGREEPWDVKFWGIGNENWGCGGSMSAEYYTNVFKRYSTYCKAEYKIASGGLFDDFEWTRVFMSEIKNVPSYIDIAHGLSYHYYTIANNWSNKGSAVDFDESEWFSSVANTLAMEPNLEEHLKIMDELDPNNQIGLIADEWGAWYDVEEGTNPGFLYQQNTLRDAIVASLGLNIFNNHAHRVKMANIAQTVNVLQAMILTKDEQLVKTPSFYVFKMYKVHQDALSLPVEAHVETYSMESGEVPSISLSASKDASGTIHVTLTNVNPKKDMELIIDFIGDVKMDTVEAEIITAATMNSFNDFGKKEEVFSNGFKDFKKGNKTIAAHIPSKSVVLFKVKAK